MESLITFIQVSVISSQWLFWHSNYSRNFRDFSMRIRTRNLQKTWNIFLSYLKKKSSWISAGIARRIYPRIILRITWNSSKLYVSVTKIFGSSQENQALHNSVTNCIISFDVIVALRITVWNSDFTKKIGKPLKTIHFK